MWKFCQLLWCHQHAFALGWQGCKQMSLYMGKLCPWQDCFRSSYSPEWCITSANWTSTLQTILPVGQKARGSRFYYWHRISGRLLYEKIVANKLDVLGFTIQVLTPGRKLPEEQITKRPWPLADSLLLLVSFYCVPWKAHNAVGMQKKNFQGK